MSQDADCPISFGGITFQLSEVQEIKIHRDGTTITVTKDEKPDCVPIGFCRDERRTA